MSAELRLDATLISATKVMRSIQRSSFMSDSDKIDGIELICELLLGQLLPCSLCVKFCVCQERFVPDMTSLLKRECVTRGVARNANSPYVRIPVICHVHLFIVHLILSPHYLFVCVRTLTFTLKLTRLPAASI